MNFFPEWENVYIMLKKKCEIDTLEIMYLYKKMVPIDYTEKKQNNKIKTR